MLSPWGLARDFAVFACLTKPVRRSELVAIVRSILGDDVPLRQEPRTLAVEPALPDPSLSAGLSSKRILLAEDNIVNQRLAVRLLENGGHHVVVASNGKEALAAWQRQQFDLILASALAKNDPDRLSKTDPAPSQRGRDFE